MKKFIAYFDYLGFKDFIEFNDIEYQKRIIGNIFRDIETALGQGEYLETNYGLVSDISKSKINCINFSDTVIFWTNDDTIESLNELLTVSHTFNWQAISYFFPVRGAIVYDDIFHVDHRQSNGGGGKYNINSLFGHGLVKAHLKADSQNWAGTVIDSSVISELSNRNLDYDLLLTNYSKKYKVPYKLSSDEVDEEEYVYWIVKGKLNEESFKNVKENIERNFAEHKKRVDNPIVIEKIKNTIKFLESFK